MKITRFALAALCSASLALSGCATTGEPHEPRTVQQKIAACAAMVLVGAALGAVIGNNTGSGNAGRGAAVGAAAGLGACGVWLAFENQQDRAYLQQAQMQAANSGQNQTRSWVGQDGNQRQVSVGASTSTEMMVPNANGAQDRRVCRTLNTTATVSGRSETMAGEVWCRNTDGSWSASPDATLPAA